MTDPSEEYYVHVWHPPFLKHILQANFENYGLAVDRKAMKLLFRNGLLTNDGASWRKQRKPGLLDSFYRHEAVVMTEN